MLPVIIKAAEEAGTIQKKYFRQEQLDISEKTSHHDIVTKADIESQDIIKQNILDEMKKNGISSNKIGFIGEEKLHEAGDHTFVIDPVDGTSNFATGLDEFGIIIGYFYKSELMAGVIYFPIKDEWFMAEKGKGAYSVKNGVKVPLKATGIDTKYTFLMASLSYKLDYQDGIHNIIRRLMPHFRGVRMIGAAVSETTLLAENIGGCVLLTGCSIWDISAGKIILEEAGFGMYDLEGNSFDLELNKPTRTYPFFACHPKYKDKILQKIKG